MQKFFLATVATIMLSGCGAESGPKNHKDYTSANRTSWSNKYIYRADCVSKVGSKAAVACVGVNSEAAVKIVKKCVDTYKESRARICKGIHTEQALTDLDNCMSGTLRYDLPEASVVCEEL